MSHLVVLVQLFKFVSQGGVDLFHLRQVKLPHLRLVGKHERLVQLLRIQSGAVEHFLRQHRMHVPDANSLAVQLLQELLNFFGQECLLDGGLQPGELLRLLNLDGSLFKSHCHPLNRSLERETGIEPATNSLEGCDSTTELLPPCTPVETQLAASSGPPRRSQLRLYNLNSGADDQD